MQRNAILWLCFGFLVISFHNTTAVCCFNKDYSNPHFASKSNIVYTKMWTIFICGLYSFDWNWIRLSFHVVLVCTIVSWLFHMAHKYDPTMKIFQLNFLNKVFSKQTKCCRKLVSPFWSSYATFSPISRCVLFFSCWCCGTIFSKYIIKCWWQRVPWIQQTVPFKREHTIWE